MIYFPFNYTFELGTCQKFSFLEAPLCQHIRTQSSSFIKGKFILFYIYQHIMLWWAVVSEPIFHYPGCCSVDLQHKSWLELFTKLKKYEDIIK